MRKGKPQSSIFKRSILLNINTGMNKPVRPVPMTDWSKFESEGTNVAAANMIIGELQDLLAVGITPVVNDLACSGMKPVGITISLMLPLDFSEEELKTLMNMYAKACRSKNIMILGGHTEVSGAVKTPVVSFTGIGTGERENAPSKDISGKDIVVIGYCGSEALNWFLRHKNEVLREHFSESFMKDAESYAHSLDVSEAAYKTIETGGECITNISSGGIFEALWNMSSYADKGFQVDLRLVPFRQHLIEFCEVFRLNPFQVRSQGALLAAVDPKKSEELIRAMEDMNVPAAVIGAFASNKDRVIINDDEQRYLNMPEADDILKLIEY